MSSSTFSRSFAIVIAFNYFSYILAAESPGTPKSNCSFFIENLEHIEKVYESCKEKLKDLSSPEWHAPQDVVEKYYMDLSKADFDDKCLAKCYMDELKLVNSEGTMIMANIPSIYKGNITEKALKDFTKSWQLCSDKIENSIEIDSKNKEASVCKRVSAIEHCFYLEAKNFEFSC